MSSFGICSFGVAGALGGLMDVLAESSSGEDVGEHSPDESVVEEGRGEPFTGAE